MFSAAWEAVFAAGFFYFVVTGQFRNPKVQHFQGFSAFRASFKLDKA